MRILHVIDSAGLYGAERVILQLLSEQRRLGHDSSLISIGANGVGDKAIEIEARKSGAKVHALRTVPGPNPVTTMRILDVARKASADVIHSHGYKPNILLGFVPKAFRRMPAVATVHGFTDARGISRMAAYRWMDLRALRRFDRVVLVHADMKNIRGLDRVLAKNTRVIENGIGSRPNDASGIDARVAAFCQNRVVVGAAGRLSY
jgi:glycosyltransferase involved in cell wall biosynthesis